MKKYLVFIYMIMFIFLLSSCGVKKNINSIGVKGTELDSSQISEIQEEYENYKNNLELEDKVKVKQWHKIKMNSIIKNSNEDTELEMYMSISGKVFSSYYSYTDKMSLTLKFKGNITDKETSTEGKFNGTIDIIYFEAIAYYDINIKMSQKNEYEKESSRQKQLIKGSISDLENIIGSSIPFGSADLVSAFFDKMDNRNSKIYQKNDNKYYYKKETASDSRTSLNEIMIKLNSDYELKEYEYYEAENGTSNGTFFETVTYLSFKKCLPKIIKEPRNAKKYVNGDFDFDLGIF